MVQNDTQEEGAEVKYPAPLEGEKPEDHPQETPETEEKEEKEEFGEDGSTGKFHKDGERSPHTLQAPSPLFQHSRPVRHHTS